MLRVSDEERRLYLFTNPFLDSYININEVKESFPELIFSQIAPQIYTVEYDLENEAVFNTFQSRLQVVRPATVLGLNAAAALDAAHISQLHDPAFGSLRGQNIIIGFVDTGIEYTLDVFKYADNTTRLVSIWDQTVEGSPPNGYDYGSIYTRAQINEALKSESPYEVVPSRDTNGHGTYLAGVAAGNDQIGGGYIGAAPDADIMMVKLRPASAFYRDYYLLPESAVAYQDNDVIAGIHFLIEESIRQAKPLVLCIAVGNNTGAHDGSTILERYLEELTIAQNLIIVVAAGSEADTGHHYNGRITQGEDQSVEINVAENDEGFFIDLWTTLPDQISISVKSPLGQLIGRIPVLSNQMQSFRFNLELTTLTVIYIYPDVQTGGQEVGLRLVTPTPGIWNIILHGENIINGTYNIWLPRRGFIREETRFLKSDPNTTINIPATGTYTIAVGAYNYIDDSVFVPSGRGPTTAYQIKPDLIAIGVNVLGPNLLGGYEIYNGTGTATAMLSGAAAILMEWAVTRNNLDIINTRIARGIFIRGAVRQPGEVYPNNIEGYGRLNLQSSIANI